MHAATLFVVHRTRPAVSLAALGGAQALLSRNGRSLDIKTGQLAGSGPGTTDPEDSDYEVNGGITRLKVPSNETIVVTRIAEVVRKIL